MLPGDGNATVHRDDRSGNQRRADPLCGLGQCFCPRGDLQLCFFVFLCRCLSALSCFVHARARPSPWWPWWPFPRTSEISFDANYTLYAVLSCGLSRPFQEAPAELSTAELRFKAMEIHAALRSKAAPRPPRPADATTVRSAEQSDFLRFLRCLGSGGSPRVFRRPEELREQLEHLAGAAGQEREEKALGWAGPHNSAARALFAGVPAALCRLSAGHELHALLLLGCGQGSGDVAPTRSCRRATRVTRNSLTESEAVAT